MVDTPAVGTNSSGQGSRRASAKALSKRSLERACSQTRAVACSAPAELCFMRIAKRFRRESAL